MFNAFIGFSELDHSVVLQYMGYDYSTSEGFWRMVLKKYLGTEDESVCESVAAKARIIGYTRLLRRAIRRPDEDGAQEHIAHYKKQLTELIDKVDTLAF